MEDDLKSNDWYQKFILQGFKDLKKGLEKSDEDQKERYERLEKKIESISVHNTPCTDLESLKTEVHTGVKIIKYFFALPLVGIIIAGIFAFLYELLKGGV